MSEDIVAKSVKSMYGRSVLLQPPHSQLLKQQSVPVEGQPLVRRSPRIVDAKLLCTMFDDVHTVHEMFLRGYKISTDKNCLGWRPNTGGEYSWISYQEVYDKVRAFGSGLIRYGAKAHKSQLVGIYSRNRVEWIVTDQACAAYSMVSVPIYDTLGPEALTHIVQQCELEIVMVDTNTRAENLLNGVKDGKMATIRLIVLVEEPSDKIISLCDQTGVQIKTVRKVEKEGKEDPKDFVPPKPWDLYTICYTSGTTGAPKGVMHSHINGVSMLSAILINSADYFRGFKPTDVVLSYLPLAHVFERYLEWGILMHGGSIGYYQGNPKLLLDDAVMLRPTIFPMVPRLVNRIYGKIMTAVNGSVLRKFVFNICLGRKMAALRRGHVSNDTIWDKIVFRKFQAALGGRVEWAVTGSAPVSTEVLNVVRCVMGIPIMEGYGQTESTCAVTCTLYGDYEGGHVGSVLPATQVKLVDVPEKGYYAKDDKGEICCKGLTVFMGYYKDEAETKETIDEDGWLHTGDIGQWLPNGALKIIDRKKHIFKLSQGEYVAPEKIEQIYSMGDVVLQVFVHGDSLKSAVVGIVVPDEDVLPNWCKEKGINVADKSFAQLCQMDEVGRHILESINKLGRHHGLKSFELVKKLFVTCEQFTIENGMMTPSLKSRRPQILRRYQKEIDHMYKDLD